MTALLFSITLTLSAFLLFWVQPMLGKMMLPVLGGAAAVWNTCMLFFQTELLLGYAYAHLLASKIKPKWQPVVHLPLMLLAVSMLPFGIPADWHPPQTSTNPVLYVLALLFTAVGLPFFILSASAPLLQKWFSYSAEREKKDPYFLYSASNFGSFLALLCFPLLLERWLSLRDQTQAWKTGFLTLAAFVVICSAAVFRSVKNFSAAAAADPVSAETISSRRKFRWVFLSFVPSSLMLGVTTYISTDIASVPLFWILPLAIYLLSFVIVFSKKAFISHEKMLAIFPFFAALLSLFIAMRANAPLWAILPMHLFFLFITAMVCHGELANDRPSASHLTGFYLWLSFGGALGGVFNALVAPLIFKIPFEYPLVLCLACLHARNADENEHPASRWLDWILPGILGGLAYVSLKLFYPSNVDGISPEKLKLINLAIFGLPNILCYTFRDRPFRFSLSLGTLMLIGLLFSPAFGKTIETQRSFFGVSTVKRLVSDKKETHHFLFHGSTVHGIQRRDPGRERDALSYYSPRGPVGDAFAVLREKERPACRVAVIGLGSGSLALYAKEGDEWDFYELDPVVAKIAENPDYFSFLKNSLAPYRILLGDGRQNISQAPDGSYDLIVIDAFGSDVIPMHLLTKEATELYISKLKKDGFIVFHVSNRYFSIGPIIGKIAETTPFKSFLGKSEADNQLQLFESQWVVLLRDENELKNSPRNADWKKPTAKKNIRLWTDDYSNIFDAF